MPSFGKRSTSSLGTCDERLQEVFNEAINHRDFSIICGHRTRKAQDEAHAMGFSKKQWPDSKHNQMPSKAIDALPYPIDWSDRERIAHFSGFILGIAQLKGFNMRWGGDWNRDGVTKDEKFFDGAHFEIVGD